MNTFNKALAVITLGCGVGFSTTAGVNALVAQLQADTIRQCQAKAWPAAKDKAMSAFCAQYQQSIATRGGY